MKQGTHIQVQLVARRGLKTVGLHADSSDMHISGTRQKSFKSSYYKKKD